MQRYIVGISGASGMPLAKRLLQALYQCPDVEVHLIISQGAQKVLQTEDINLNYDSNTELQSDGLAGLTSDGLSGLTSDGLSGLKQYAHVMHDVYDISAGPASGSWKHSGMVVCPCSMSSLASIASGAGQNLLHRAADVCIKEGRPLILAPRETPFSTIHLQNMLTLSKIGVKIMPPCPAFYGKTYTLESIIEHFIARILDQLKIEHNLGFHWKEQ